MFELPYATPTNDVPDRPGTISRRYPSGSFAYNVPAIAPADSAVSSVITVPPPFTIRSCRDFGFGLAKVNFTGRFLTVRSGLSLNFIGMKEGPLPEQISSFQVSKFPRIHNL